MSSQLLVNVITATVPASVVNYAVEHGLRSNDTAVAPTLVLPQAQTPVTIVSADEANVYLSNSSGSDITVTLRCERDLSMQADAASVTPFYMSTGTPGGGVETLSVTAPITIAGTAEAPIIGAAVGNTPGTVCAGNDPRLSDQRVPTNGSVTDAKVASANKDGAAGTPSMRTLGTGSQQACAGNDTRLIYTSAVSGDFPFPPASGSLGTGATAYIAPATQMDVVIPSVPGKLRLISMQFSESYIQNPTASIIRVSYSLVANEGGVDAGGILYVNPGQTLIIPDIFNWFVGAGFGVTYTNIRLKLQHLSAGTINYTVDNDARIFISY